jgi:hypothetical protein
VTSPSVALLASPPTARQVGRAVEVTIPLDGPLDGLSHYALAGPDGIALKLPRASAPITGSTPLEVGRVERTWVKPLAGGGVHVRVFTRGGVPDYRISVVDGAVRVTVLPGNRELAATQPAR